MARKYNFNAGPAVLPVPVLEKARETLPEYGDTGIGMMETSHRAPAFDEIINSARDRMCKLLGIPEGYKVLFLQGGASMQFAMIPMNLLGSDQVASYHNTGTWSRKAIAEAKRFGEVRVPFTSEEQNFNNIPGAGVGKPQGDEVYLHFTTNNTIVGTQYSTFPEAGEVPLIADMSSDIMCRKIDVSDFGLIYAGAQKNLGPSGVTIVIIRDDLVARCPDTVPTMLNYRTHAEKKSLFNTPSTWPIFIVGLVMEWLEEQGGLDAMEDRNRHKAGLLYNLLDEMPDYFRGTAERESRSIMNVTCRLPSEELEKKFLAESVEAGFVGLKGHRSVGGLRASIYNSCPTEGVEELVAFMRKFAAQNS